MGLQRRANRDFAVAPLHLELIMMKYKILATSLLLTTFAACAETPKVATNASANVSNKTEVASLTTSSHSANKTDEKNTAKPDATSPSKSENSPPPMMSGNAEPIDTTEFDAEITKTEVAYKAKPQDAAAKKDLANALAKRGFALTQAAQYRTALGDFRKSLKLEPNNQEVKDMSNRIVDVYKSLNREPPKEGEEPPPLPFKKA